MTSPETALFPPEPPRQGALSRRLWAMALRLGYLLAGSWPRLIDLIYWPTLDMLMWGFLNHYMSLASTGLGIVSGVILGACMMWNIMLRSQISLFQSFMEELWSRNIGHIYVSPLRPQEYVLGLVLVGIVRVTIAMTPCLLFAQLFFGFWLPGLGLPALLFAVSLALSGWWGGLLLMSLMLRFGYAAEWMAWMFMFILSPFIAVYYPVSVLPSWIQNLSWLLPPTYVFEGLRALLNGKTVLWDYWIRSMELNLVFFALALFFFLRTFERTRRATGLLQVYE